MDRIAAEESTKKRNNFEDDLLSGRNRVNLYRTKKCIRKANYYFGKNLRKNMEPVIQVDLRYKPDVVFANVQ